MEKETRLTIIVDTGTWLKLDYLASINVFSAEQVYSWNQVVISHQVEDELTHFKCASMIKKNTRILPIKNLETYNEALSLGFDDADASLASMGEKESESTTIVTEDRPFLDYLELNKISAILGIRVLRPNLGKHQGKKIP